MLKKIVLIMATLLFSVFIYSNCMAKKSFNIAWSHYTGWEPWEYASYSGILDKWAKKYNIEIKLSLVNDYIESINLYTAGSYDGCVMTNMDALTIPAVGGVDSTALIIGDFSKGNDGIVIKNGTTISDLRNRRVMLVELSVSHYLLTRALVMNKMTEKDLTLVNTSDADIAALFAADSNAAVVTWNPPLIQCRNVKGAKLIFDSSKIPGEIIDMMVVRTKTPDTLKKALTGAWYETISIMQEKSKKGKNAIEYMAEFAGGTVPEFKAQLKTTAMFYRASDAVNFAKGDALKKTMEYVRTFSFQHGLFGDAESESFVGILFPDDSVMGNKGNIKLRFDASFMQMAAEGKL